jgi:hypothetical protein
MANHVEIEEFITPARVEYAYAKACKAQAEGRQSFADTGWRAARARDPKLLKALEQGAEILDRMTEQQYGRTMRDPGAEHGHTKGTTEANLWREAYRMCDEGTALENFCWVYGAAAWLCGYNI